MLRGEGGGAWDIVCGDEKGDVFESMVLKVLKERHDAEYYVNFLTNMIGLQHGIAGLAHVCLSPGTLGLGGDVPSGPAAPKAGAQSATRRRPHR